MPGSVVPVIRRWILEPGWKAATRAFRLGLWVLGRIFRPSFSCRGPVPLGSPSRAFRYLQCLGRLRRREGMIACDLGSLGRVVYRQGLLRESWTVSGASFGGWSFPPRFRWRSLRARASARHDPGA